MKVSLLIILVTLSLATYVDWQVTEIKDAPSGKDFRFYVKEELNWEVDDYTSMDWIGWVLCASQDGKLKVGDPGIYFTANLNIDGNTVTSSTDVTDNFFEFFSSTFSTIKSVVWNGTAWKDTAKNFVKNTWTSYGEVFKTTSPAYKKSSHEYVFDIP